MNLRRTRKMVKFTDLCVGNPFFAHGRVWIRIDELSAVALGSSGDYGGSCCDFTLDACDEFVEAIEYTPPAKAEASPDVVSIFYPNRWWGGYARFFDPCLREEDGERLTYLVHEAIKGRGEWEPVLRMLTMSHYKNKVVPDETKIRCDPTPEADAAVDAILLKVFGKHSRRDAK